MEDQGTAVTFTNGLDLNVGALGIHLSTRTGFNSNTKSDGTAYETVLSLQLLAPDP